MDCYPCRVSAELDDQPDRERVWVEEHWRVAHDFNSSLAGWLVLVPRRHVTGLDELSPLEAQRLGELLRAGSIAMRAVVGCEKTYVMLFAEAEGFSHLHVHLVPRMPDIPVDHRGPQVFAYHQPPAVPEGERDELARKLREAWALA
jgi:diadenosine tetraphosphate (Ap4A) HIT family hydrolase